VRRNGVQTEAGEVAPGAGQSSSVPSGPQRAVGLFRSPRRVAFGESLVPGYPFWLERTDGARFNSTLQKTIFAEYATQAVQPEAGHLDQLRATAARFRCARPGGPHPDPEIHHGTQRRHAGLLPGVDSQEISLMQMAASGVPPTLATDGITSENIHAQHPLHQEGRDDGEGAR